MSTHHLAHLDWIILIIYMLISVIAGLVMSRRANTSTEEYFLSGRSLPWWLLGTSIVATGFSSDTPLYVTNLVRKGGIAENWQWWSFAIGGMLGAVWLAPLWRRAGIMTDVELTELRYSGKTAGFLRGFRGVWLALLVNSISMGWIMLAMAKIAYVCFGWDKVLSLTVLCSVTLVYTLMGGLWGVILADFVQYIIAQVGAILLAFFAIRAVGGMDKLVTFMHDTSHWQPNGPVPPEPLSFIPPVFGVDNLITAAFGAFCVYTLVQWWAFLNSDGGGKVVQRLLAAKSEGHAMGGFFWFNIANYAIRTWPWIIVALASFMLYPAIADPEMAYPKMMVDLMPTGMLGIMLASFMAAFMSSTTSHVNWGASYMMNDIYRRFMVKGRPDKHYLSMGWLFSAIALLLGGLAAYLSSSVTTTFQFVITLGSGVGPIYLLRWLWWRVNATAELSALIMSTLLAAVWVFVRPEWMTFSVRLILTAFPTLLVAVIISLTTKPTSMENLIEFYRRTRPPGWWKPILAAVEANPLPNRPLPEKTKGTRVIWHWMLGLGLIYGLTFGIGWMLFGDWVAGISAIAIAAVCGLTVWNHYRKKVMVI